jgi:hypothetical protein
MAIEGDRKKDANVPDMLQIELQGPKQNNWLIFPLKKESSTYKQITMDGLNIMVGFGPKVTILLSL